MVMENGRRVANPVALLQPRADIDTDTDTK